MNGWKAVKKCDISFSTTCLGCGSAKILITGVQFYWNTVLILCSHVQLFDVRKYFFEWGSIEQSYDANERNTAYAIIALTCIICRPIGSPIPNLGPCSSHNSRRWFSLTSSPFSSLPCGTAGKALNRFAQASVCLPYVYLTMVFKKFPPQMLIFLLHFLHRMDATV